MATMRQPTPHLVNTPSPSGKYANFGAYIDHCVQLVGTNHQVGVLLGFTSGTRVADWRRAQGGRPSLTSVLKLAKLTSDHPLDILTMAGYEEEVALLLPWMRQEAPPGALSDALKEKPLQQIDSAMAALIFAKQHLEGL
jgi:hypothetical protein